VGYRNSHARCRPYHYPMHDMTRALGAAYQYRCGWLDPVRGLRRYCTLLGSSWCLLSSGWGWGRACGRLIAQRDGMGWGKGSGSCSGQDGFACTTDFNPLACRSISFIKKTIKTNQYSRV
jgi:hypothetical protein